VGKSPEELRAHFSLSFLPCLICDANIPAGHQVTVGKLTNLAGKRVSIYVARTALDLASERPLTPENIPPQMWKPRQSEAREQSEAGTWQRGEQIR